MSQEESSSQEISAYFVLFCFLLAVVLILSNVLHHHPRVASIFPEAGMILSVGVCVGAVVQLVSTATGMNNNSNDDDDDSPSSYYYDKNDDAANDYEYNNINNDDADNSSTTVATASLFSFSPELFFLIWLPPIIFNSGFHLRKELFVRHFTPICLLAVVGTTVSTFVIAGVLQLACQYILTDTSFQPHITELLTFGALLSATDPVTTLAVFQQKRVDPQLFYLVFGESVLNDAVGIVLFDAFSQFVAHRNDAGKIAIGLGQFITGFLYDSIGSPILGIALGVFTAWIFRVIDMRSTQLLELSLFVMIMYVPFLLAEVLHLSGIVTILFSGMAAQSYIVPNLTQEAAENADVLFRLAAHLAETAIFLELGLSALDLSGSMHVWFLLATLVACLIGRAANVYPIAWFFNRRLRRKTDGPDDGVTPRSYMQRKNQLQENIALDDTSTSELSMHSANHRTETELKTPLSPAAVEMTQVSASNESNQQQKILPTLDRQVSSEADGLRRSEGENSNSYFSTTPSVRLDLRISMQTAHMLWFSGLRGAVAYACVRSFPNTFGHANEFIITTMAVVFVSVFALGGTTEYMLKQLDIEMDVDEDSYMESWAREGRGGRLIKRLDEVITNMVVRGDDETLVCSVVPRESDAPNGLALEPISSSDIHGEDDSTPKRDSPTADFHPHHFDDCSVISGAGAGEHSSSSRRRRRLSVFDYGSKS